MKDEILQTITSVIGALNNIEVKGRQNLMNLVGAIGVLEELAQKISMQGKPTDKPDLPAEREEAC